MTSHADTIREYVMDSAGHTLTIGVDERHWKALAALDALLAEIQQLREAAQEYVDAEVEDTVALRALVEGSIEPEDQQRTREKADAAFEKLCAALAAVMEE